MAGLLEGRTVEGIGRRGKFLWCEFAGEDSVDPHRDVLHIHLGMSGQLRVGTQDSRHVRIRAILDDGTQLSFVDQRTFGYWRLGPWADISHIAPDPLEEQFSADAAATALRSTRRVVKAVLLDQAVLSGVGNIYADESLWLAQIHPQTRACELSQVQALRLVAAVQDVMRRALDAGGTSFDALYVNVNGESGYFARSLQAYGRTGQPCERCGSEIIRAVVAGRGTHWCPSCQTLPGAP